MNHSDQSTVKEGVWHNDIYILINRLLNILSQVSKETLSELRKIQQLPASSLSIRNSVVKTAKLLETVLNLQTLAQLQQAIHPIVSPFLASAFKLTQIYLKMKDGHTYVDGLESALCVDLTEHGDDEMAIEIAKSLKTRNPYLDDYDQSVCFKLILTILQDASLTHEASKAFKAWTLTQPNFSTEQDKIIIKI